MVDLDKHIAIRADQVAELIEENKRRGCVGICAQVVRDNKDADDISIPISGMSALEIALDGLEGVDDV